MLQSHKKNITISISHNDLREEKKFSQIPFLYDYHFIVFVKGTKKKRDEEKIYKKISVLHPQIII